MMGSFAELYELLGQSAILVIACVFLAKTLREQLTARIESVEKRADLCEKDRSEMRERYEAELTGLRDKYEALLREGRGND